MAGEATAEDANEIYDISDFVKSIVNGTPVEEVVLSALPKVQEGLRRLDKLDVGMNVLGRSSDLKRLFRNFLDPSSQLN